MNPNAKISDSFLPAIESKFGDEQKLKQDSEKVAIKLKEIIELGSKKKTEEEDQDDAGVKEIIIKTNISSEAPVQQAPAPVQTPATPAPAPAPAPKETGTATAEEKPAADTEEKKTDDKPAGGLKIIGSIDLSQLERKPSAQPQKKEQAEEKPAVYAETEKPAAQEPAAVTEPEPAPVAETPSVRKPFYMALKTNMLYDAALVPNAGVEFHIALLFRI